MTHVPPSDEDLDRLLTPHGGPAGPELDALWANIAPKVAQPAAATPWWRRWVLVAAPTLAAAAALLVVVWPGGDDGFAPRGHPQNAAVVTVDCGDEAAPCVVGKSAHVVLTVNQPGTYTVELIDGTGARALFDNDVAQAGAITLPLEIEFGPEDVSARVQLVVKDAAGQTVHSVRVHVRDE